MILSKFKPLEKRIAFAKMITRLFYHWGVSIEDQLALLGYSTRSRYIVSRYQNGAPLAYRKDLLERVAHLLAIHECLRIIFPYNRDLVYRWVTSENSNEFFLGETPLAVMKTGVQGLVKVRSYLRAVTMM